MYVLQLSVVITKDICLAVSVPSPLSSCLFALTALWQNDVALSVGVPYPMIYHYTASYLLGMHTAASLAVCGFVLFDFFFFPAPPESGMEKKI